MVHQIGLKSSPTVSAATDVNDKMKNIYDLEGNYLEWTAQALDTLYRVYRGGDYHNVSGGNFYPASDRSNANPGYTNAPSSSRQSLYVSL